MRSVLDVPTMPDQKPADRFMRQLLRVSPVQSSESLVGARNALSTSIVLSGIRCMFTYLLFPLAAPAFGLTSGVDGVVTAILGFLAVFFSVSSMRRFWRADHRYRWAYTGFAFVVIAWVIVDFALRMLWPKFF